MTEREQAQKLAIDDPAVAQFVAECGILDDTYIQKFRAAHNIGPGRPEIKHKVAIKLECVDLDDLIMQAIAIEYLFPIRLKFATPRQNGRGWYTKASIKAE